MTYTPNFIKNDHEKISTTLFNNIFCHQTGYCAKYRDTARNDNKKRYKYKAGQHDGFK
ncbi:MAG: hypothetical protein JWQ79_492 [Mucilaginibacter sp.]|nr:hypothetical protein [Mucilaginibacter sp.]